MAAIDDLNAAVTTLTGVVNTLTDTIAANDSAIQDEIVALQNFIAPGDQAAISASAQKIASLSGNLSTAVQKVQAETDALKASLAAPAPVQKPAD